MKLLLSSACAACSLFASMMPATAADLGLAPATYDWSGGYVGVAAGGAFSNSDFRSNYRYAGSPDIGEAERSLIDELDHSATENESAFTSGILAGYNVQMSGLVLGVEGDFNYLGFAGRVKSGAGEVMDQVLDATGTRASDTIDYEGSWYGTLRARVGYAADNVLVYGTGGLAYGQLDVTQKLSAVNGDEYVSWSSEQDAWRMGWALGAGVEYALDRWTMGLEYLYVDLGTFDWGAGADVSLADPAMQADWSEVRQMGEADYAFSVARASLKYRF